MSIISVMRREIDMHLVKTMRQRERVALESAKLEILEQTHERWTNKLIELEAEQANKIKGVKTGLPSD